MDSKSYYSKLNLIRQKMELVGMQAYCKEKGYNLPEMNRLFYGDKDFPDDVLDKLFYDIN